MRKPKATTIIEEVPLSAFIRGLMHTFFTPWLLMLTLGALGHHLDIPYLFRFGYVVSFLACFAVNCLVPPNPLAKLRMRSPDKDGN